MLVEVNCETDFVARGDDFTAFAREVAAVALAARPADVEALGAQKLAIGETVDERRRALVAKIGENISVRRFERVESHGPAGQLPARHPHRHAGGLEGGDAALAQ